MYKNLKGTMLIGLLVLVLTLGLSAQDFSLRGFASMNGGTTGGSGGPTVTVSTGSALQDAIDAGGPRIIKVDGTITQGNSSDSKINVKDVDDITIIGVSNRGEFNGIGIKVWRASNVIIRNLRIHHVADGDKDCVGIEGPANNVWVDHCELYNDLDHDKDYYDGLFDAKGESEYITFSWNYIHDSYKTSLIGSSDSDDHDRKVTYHHNWIANSFSRLPSYRFGTGHIYNNYYSGIIDTGINCRMGARIRIEGNYFQNSKDPIGYWYSDDTGYWDVRDNIFDSCTGSQPTTSTGSFSPPYSYSLDSASSVRSMIQANAGVGVIDGGGSSNPTIPPSATNPPATNPPATNPPAQTNPFYLSSGSTTTIEAENVTYSAAAVETEHSGYSGSGYVNFDNEPGGYIEWTVNLNSAAQTSCVVRYANGGDAGRPLDISVNGSVAGSNDCAVTGDWTSWNTVTFNLSLGSGNSVIRLTGNGSEGGPNVDRMEMTPSGGGYTNPPTQQPTAPPVGTDSIGFNPTSYSVGTNSQVTTYVVANTNASIGAYGLTINYDSSRLSYVSASDNGFGMDPVINSNSPGSLVLTAFNATGSNNSGLVAVTWQAGGSTGSTTLSVQVDQFTDVDYNNLGTSGGSAVVNITSGGTPGDVNEDGNVDIVDALMIAQYSVGLGVNMNTAVADVNCSGAIDIVDALMVAQYSVGLLSSLNC